MPAFAAISPEKLFRLIGTPKAPVVLDVRLADAVERRPLLIPASRRVARDALVASGGAYAGRPVVVACESGRKISEGTAAWLRHRGAAAEVLDGGVEAWAAANLPMVPASALPSPDASGRTVWVTRSRPKIDRIACPWLIRRFVDPDAVFLFVAAGEVEAVAERFSATPFDVEGVFWSHRGESCTFDTMVETFGLSTEPLRRMAAIVRGADTDRHGLAPEAAGLLAVSLGLSRMFADDLQQLEAGMVLYDALYRWARDATDETHGWTSHGPKSARP